MITPKQRLAFEVTERVGSVLSLIGTAFIIGTFLTDKAFHKPINRLVFFASWGNIIANIGTLISTSGVDAGDDSPLCQSQAFLINTFMPADALWTLAMACNVYLTFFRHYNAQQLRALEWKYLVFCYGVPLLPSLVFLFVNHPEKGRIFDGSAILWCWIAAGDWAFLRIAAFYGPVWIVIIITFAIYLWAGKEIFARRRQLRNFSAAASDAPFPVIQNPFLSPFVSVKTTEVQVTSEFSPIPVDARSTNSFVLNDSGRIVSSRGVADYKVSVEGGNPADPPPGKVGMPDPRASATATLSGTDRVSRQHKAAVEANKAAISYCRCALLFFASLLITWVPSSLNRVYSLVSDKLSFGLLFIASLVLPLQGFWNAVIYIATSIPACKAFFRRWADACSAAAPRRHGRSTASYPSLPSPKVSRISSEDSMKAFATQGERRS